MNTKIRNYVEHIFDGKPKTKKITELKDELIANLVEKYNDLLKDKSEEEAYNSVIASIGDIDELIGELNDSSNMYNYYMQTYQNKKAKYTAIAVMLYILSVLPIIYFDIAWNQAEVGVMLMFIMIATATGMLVYVGVSKPKNLIQGDERVVESKLVPSQKGKLKFAILSSFWLLLIAAYFILSFNFYIWNYSWIIFIIGAAIHQIITAIFEIRGE